MADRAAAQPGAHGGLDLPRARGDAGHTGGAARGRRADRGQQRHRPAGASAGTDRDGGPGGVRPRDDGTGPGAALAAEPGRAGGRGDRADHRVRTDAAPARRHRPADVQPVLLGGLHLLGGAERLHRLRPADDRADLLDRRTPRLAGPRPYLTAADADRHPARRRLSAAPVRLCDGEVRPVAAAGRAPDHRGHPGAAGDHGAAVRARRHLAGTRRAPAEAGSGPAGRPDRAAVATAADRDPRCGAAVAGGRTPQEPPAAAVPVRHRDPRQRAGPGDPPGPRPPAGRRGRLADSRVRRARAGPGGGGGAAAVRRLGAAVRSRGGVRGAVRRPGNVGPGGRDQLVRGGCGGAGTARRGGRRRSCTRCPAHR
ncbi:hypothetical protein SAMN05444716_101739 [Streptomyces harbinensis]|uniref:Uncharacterized protein n=1 Tax=Streptomyces harbinensis TaxID=1176198 RepID=A0A1I6PUT8_9ACTN|nr:hypothetical protein SAMN05444716_101739 [Streptomyces harbinensis]